MGGTALKEPKHDYSKYQPIIEAFRGIKGVKKVMLDSENDNHLALFASNDMTGKNAKTFRFILKEEIAARLSGDGQFFCYDILDLDDPDLFIQIGLKKAYMFFNDEKEFLEADKAIRDYMAKEFVKGILIN